MTPAAFLGRGLLAPFAKARRSCATRWAGLRPANAAWRTFGRSARSGESGDTLVELLVVLAIIGLMVGFVGPRVLGYLSDSPWA